VLVPRILLLDDDIAEISAVKRVLTRSGHQPVLATNASDAVTVIDTGAPDLLVVSSTCEGGEALALTRRLAEDEATAGIPVILLGEAGGAPATARQVPRPIDPAQLADEVKTLLAAGARRVAVAGPRAAAPAASPRAPAAAAPRPAPGPSRPGSPPGSASAANGAPRVAAHPPASPPRPAPAAAPRPASPAPDPAAARRAAAEALRARAAELRRTASPSAPPPPEAGARNERGERPASGAERSASDDRRTSGAAARAVSPPEALGGLDAEELAAFANLGPASLDRPSMLELEDDLDAVLRRAEEAERAKLAERERARAEARRRSEEQEQARRDAEGRAAAEERARRAAADEASRRAVEARRQAEEEASALVLAEAEAGARREAEARAAADEAFREVADARARREAGERERLAAEAAEKTAAETRARRRAEEELASLRAQLEAERQSAERRIATVMERAAAEEEASETLRRMAEAETRRREEETARVREEEEERLRSAIESARAEMEALRRRSEEEARRRAQAEAELRRVAEAESELRRAAEGRAARPASRSQATGAEIPMPASAFAFPPPLGLSEAAPDFDAPFEADPAALAGPATPDPAEDAARRRVAALRAGRGPDPHAPAPTPIPSPVIAPPADSEPEPASAPLALPPAELRSGTLADLPAPRLLALAARTRLAGRVDFQGEAARSLWFEDGRVVGAASADPSERVEELALRLGLVTRDQHRQIASAAATLGTRRAALLLLERGYLKPTELSGLVRRRTEEVVFGVFADEAARFRWIAQEVPGDERTALERAPLALAVEGVRRRWLAPRVDALLGGAGTLLAPVASGPAAADLALSPDERRALALADGLRTLDEVVLASPLDALSTRQLLAALVLVGALSVRLLQAGRPQAAAAQAIDLVRVREKLDQVRRADYFTVLGVGRVCTPHEIREAAERLATELDPRRYAGVREEGLPERLAEILQVVRDARDVLADDHLRDEYLRGLGD
jgi:CheY-like chemotaxis protein